MQLSSGLYKERHGHPLVTIHTIQSNTRQHAIEHNVLRYSSGMNLYKSLSRVNHRVQFTPKPTHPHSRKPYSKVVGDQTLTGVSSPLPLPNKVSRKK